MPRWCSSRASASLPVPSGCWCQGWIQYSTYTEGDQSYDRRVNSRTRLLEGRLLARQGLAPAVHSLRLRRWPWPLARAALPTCGVRSKSRSWRLWFHVSHDGSVRRVLPIRGTCCLLTPSQNVRHQAFTKACNKRKDQFQRHVLIKTTIGRSVWSMGQPGLPKVGR
jgi:hypothetical protein